TAPPAAETALVAADTGQAVADTGQAVGNPVAAWEVDRGFHSRCH
ncbi:MAG: hypothetical protein QOF47_2259, partial [Mycobacterium sp.]|nr:hypothetical protein [Mycobacterium sp.]